MWRLLDARDGTKGYERLSPGDWMFLACEREKTPMNVGATLVFEGVPEPSMLARLRAHVQARLVAMPPFRRRIERAWVGGPTIWIDDDRFDVAAHVWRESLRPPGDDASLCSMVGRILARPLDPGRPLWELCLIDGLAGRRFALVSKMHHCMVDGVAGAGLLPVLLSPDPKADVERGSDWQAERPPPTARIVLDTLARPWQWAGGAVAEILEVVREPDRAGAWLDALRGIGRTVALGARPAPDSPINRPIEAHRRVAWLVSDLAQVRRIKERLGGTINDVVLAVVSGALRRFLHDRDPEAEVEDLRALVPVNVRPDGDGSFGNRVSAWIVPLPLRLREPLGRHQQVRLATAELRAMHVARGGELLTGLGSLLLTVGLPLLERVQPFNLVVSNIPGPQAPLYLLGARLVDVHPHVPLFPNQGLSVAVLSYAGRLGWGFVGDCHVLADLERFAGAVRSALDDLASAAGVTSDRANAIAVPGLELARKIGSARYPAETPPAANRART